MYTPSGGVKDPEVLRELQSISRAFTELLSQRLAVTHVEPLRPRDGVVAICDGSDWDPLSDGIKRPVWFDEAAGVWKAF